jgi:trimethylamine---corrinoid protein Co-methyltransferase
MEVNVGGDLGPVRPRLQLFTAEQVERVISDALAALERVGFFVENEEALTLLAGARLKRDGQRVFVGEAAVQRALATAPSRVTVFDRDGQPALDLGGDAVHFDPGSAALHVLDPATGRHRKPVTGDLVHLAWVTEACQNIAGQSTALIPGDVPEVMGDRCRLYAALLNSRKPIITGTFRKDAFAVMRAMLAAVRGGEAELAQRPLAIFDCCPTPPLKWSDLTCQALIDCARSGVPAELVSMPLAGATAPVTLREMVVQHCAESLSGVLIHQLVQPGAPIIWGGSPSAFDMRHGTTPMGAIETMMVDAAYAQVGKQLGLPTHAYMGLSDAKGVDYQAGLESGLGAVLAALAGINMISGPGMLDFESCQSLEKLVLDNETCGMALRLVRGIGHGSAEAAVDLLRQLVELGSLLGHRHTRANFRAELFFPGAVLDRSSYGDWEKAGARDAREAAHIEVTRIIAQGNPAPAPADLRKELARLLAAEAGRLGIASLPAF